MIAAVPRPVEGPWGARTSDALPVAFRVHEGRIEGARFTFRWGFRGAFRSDLPNEETIPVDGSWAYLDGRGRNGFGRRDRLGYRPSGFDGRGLGLN